MRGTLDQIRNDILTLDARAIAALSYSAFGLAAIFYLQKPASFSLLFNQIGFENFVEQITNSPENNLPALAWWVAVAFIFYFVIPASIIKYSWRMNLSDFGLRLSIEPGFLKMLAGLAAIMLPLVYLMSRTDGFASKYPFLKIYNGEPYLGFPFFAWELIYFFQFFGLEFFFRGFLVNSLKRALGLYSIFVMTVPYTMIHFGKPPAETLAAIIAGISLGWLSCRNGTIWMGLILHCTVAFSMDVLALYAKGLLF